MVELLWSTVYLWDPEEMLATAAGLLKLAWHLDEVFVKINGETHYLGEIAVGLYLVELGSLDQRTDGCTV